MTASSSPARARTEVQPQSSKEFIAPHVARPAGHSSSSTRTGFQKLRPRYINPALWRLLPKLFKLFFDSSESSLQNAPFFFNLAQLVFPSRTDKSASPIRFEILFGITAMVMMIMAVQHTYFLLCSRTHIAIINHAGAMPTKTASRDS